MLGKALSFVLLAASPTVPAPGTNPGQGREREVFALEDASVVDLAQALAARRTSSEALIRLYLERIRRFDQSGPRINAVVTLNPAAIEEAKRLDLERERKGPRSPLHGIPVLLKDVFNTADMRTTVGFAGLSQSRPTRDSNVARRLREAGAIILAKVNMLDFVFGTAPFPGSGVTGITLNPIDVRYYTGGSSTGTAAGVAANFAPIGFGSDLDGSNQTPAANTSLFALVPTRGLIGRGGMAGGTLTQERAGIMARHVPDLAAALDAVAGLDPEDLLTLASAGRLPERSYVAGLDGATLKGVRLGVFRDYIRSGEAQRHGLAAFDRAVQALRANGVRITDPVSTGLALLDGRIEEANTLGFEARYAGDRYLSTLGPSAPFGSTDALLAGLPRDAVSSDLASARRTLDRDPAYRAVLAAQARLRETLVGAMDARELDALVLPFKTRLIGQLPFPAGGDAEQLGFVGGNPVSSVTGLPSIIIPAGCTDIDGMPFALQIIGRPFDEVRLLRIARAFELGFDPVLPARETPALPGETIALPGRGATPRTGISLCASAHRGRR